MENNRRGETLVRGGGTRKKMKHVHTVAVTAFGIGKGRAQLKCCTPLLSPMCCVRDRAGTSQCHIPVATTRLATSRHKTGISFYSQGL